MILSNLLRRWPLHVRGKKRLFPSYNSLVAQLSGNFDNQLAVPLDSCRMLVPPRGSPRHPCLGSSATFASWSSNRFNGAGVEFKAHFFSTQDKNTKEKYSSSQNSEINHQIRTKHDPAWTNAWNEKFDSRIVGMDSQKSSVSTGMCYLNVTSKSSLECKNNVC